MNIIAFTTLICSFFLQDGLSFTSPFASKVATLKPKETPVKKNKFQLSTKTVNKKKEPAKEKASFNYPSFGNSKPAKQNSSKNDKKKISKQVTAKEKASFNYPSFGNSKPANQNSSKNDKKKISKQVTAKEKVSFNFESFGNSKASKQNNIKDDKKKVKQEGKIPTKAESSGGAKLPEIKVPELKLPELPDFSVVEVPSPIGFVGSSMQLLKPLFTAEAQLQAGVLVNAVDLVGSPFRIYPDEIRAALKKRISSTKPVLYTYVLSPFSKEAKQVLKDYDVEIVEVGYEWFFLGPERSEWRLALAENSESYQTSLPHLFVKGESLGGLSTGGRNNAGILGLQRSGQLDKVLKKRKK